ncbi:hypothetical protein DPMN_174555, partial [Dreissena polymorpha]
MMNGRGDKLSPLHGRSCLLLLLTSSLAVCSVSGLSRAHDHHYSNQHSNKSSNSNHDGNTQHHTTVKDQ